MDRTRTALREMAREDPELAARLVLQTLPAAAAKIKGPLRYELTVTNFGTWTVVVDENGGARMEPGQNGEVDFALSMNPETLAQMAAGANPMRLMLGGKVRIRGKRRRALALRAMGDGSDLSMADALAGGATLDADAVYRSLAYMVDPEWTRGHSFTIAYEVVGEGGGRWFVHVNDGERLRVTTEPPAGPVAATTRVSLETFTGLMSGQITPAQSMREQRAEIEGEIYPIVMLGRWIDRSQGRDDAELQREAQQRAIQARRAGSWGSSTNGAMPLEVEGAERSPSENLMSYGELYALWERQNWRAHEIDFSVDREQWVATPAEAQENTAWSLGAFYIGEERVTADLAPFLLAAPSGEVEAFLSTQLVDEARHAVFFDRFGAEVMALGADDLRGRMLELQALMLPPWFDTFDNGLRDIANRIKANPDDLDLFVQGITTYHLIIEGVLATTGQRMILKYTEDHGLYPGFQKGFSLVEQDEHRHIAFGVRFLRDAVADDPKRHGATIERTVADLVPRAAHVFVPAYADSPAEFVSYGYHSSYIYGYAYRKLKRRLGVLGLDCPPPEELMPGPIASVEEARAAAMPV